MSALENALFYPVLLLGTMGALLVGGSGALGLLFGGPAAWLWVAPRSGYTTVTRTALWLLVSMELLALFWIVSWGY